MAKRSRVNVTQQVDEDTGEIVETRRSFVYDTPSSTYARLYLDEMDALTPLNKSETAVLVSLVRRLPYNSDKVYVDREFYKECDSKYELSKGTVQNALTSLIKQGLIRRYQRGVYGVTPHLFWRGTEKDRLDNL